jgi:hypothetical protein
MVPDRAPWRQIELLPLMAPSSPSHPPLRRQGVVGGLQRAGRRRVEGDSAGRSSLPLSLLSPSPCLSPGGRPVALGPRPAALLPFPGVRWTTARWGSDLAAAALIAPAGHGSQRTGRMREGMRSSAGTHTILQHQFLLFPFFIGDANAEPC